MFAWRLPRIVLLKPDKHVALPFVSPLVLVSGWNCLQFPLLLPLITVNCFMGSMQTSGQDLRRFLISRPRQDLSRRAMDYETSGFKWSHDLVTVMLEFYFELFRSREIASQMPQIGTATKYWNPGCARAVLPRPRQSRLCSPSKRLCILASLQDSISKETWLWIGWAPSARSHSLFIRN